MSFNPQLRCENTHLATAKLRFSCLIGDQNPTFSTQQYFLNNFRMKEDLMNLIDTKTGQKIRGKIKKLTSAQIKKLKGSKKFQFDWSLEKANEVYSINRISNSELLGLISLTDVAEELRIHINLVESIIEHQGKEKGVDGILGCLIGFACQVSFTRGYDGFVSLVPKTKLVNYYHKKFGFLHMGRNMVVFLEISQSIITKYLKNE